MTRDDATILLSFPRLFCQRWEEVGAAGEEQGQR